MAVGRVCGGKRIFFCLFSLQDGCTAVIYSSFLGHADCVRLLLDAGADKDAKGNVRASDLLFFQCLRGHSLCDSCIRAGLFYLLAL
jgi:hypothetical protein